MSDSPLTLIDGDSYQWDIQTDGSIGDGTENAYDGGLKLEGFPAYGNGNSDVSFEDGGREVVIGPRFIGDGYGRDSPIAVTRKIYIAQDQGFARFLEVVTNTGSTSFYYTVNLSTDLGSNGNTEVVQTSDGDKSLTPADNWLITDDTYDPYEYGLGADRPTMLQVLAGAGGYRPSYVSAATGNDRVSLGYNLELAPGETKIVMHFAAQSSDQAIALAKAEQLTLLGLDALAGLSTEEKSLIVNFDTGINNTIPPDLVVSHINVPDAASIGDTTAISWTIANQGRGPAQGEWNNYVYLSDDAILDASDQLLSGSFGENYLNGLAIDEQHTFTRNITLPLDASLGNKYLLFVTDPDNSQVETNEDNNISAVQLTLNAPDLVIAAPTQPAIVLGEPLSFSWTVTNQGSGSAAAPYWSDAVYLSEDMTLDASDLLLTSQGRYNSLPLAAGESYTVDTGSFYLPTITTIGNRYLLFATDREGAQRESNEGNNVQVMQVEIQAPDLAVSNLTVPVEAFSGQQIEVVWHVTNQGNKATDGTWTDQIYVHNTVTGEDLLLGQFASTGVLAAGQSIERKQLITLPLDLSGNFQFVVKTGDALLAGGRDPISTNNTLVDDRPINIQLSPFPNLQVLTVIAPETAFSGQQTMVEWTVTNTGTGSTSASMWYDAVWLSTDGTLDESDIYLGKVANTSYLNPGESYTNRLSVVLPETVDGRYQFLVETDGSSRGLFDVGNFVYELNNEGDNVGASNATQVALTPPPDLEPIAINAPSQAFSGQTMSLSWTVVNNGPGVTKGLNWIDSLYMSADNILDEHDILLANRSHNGSLEPGQSYQSTWDVTLPIGVRGDFYFFVKTDSNNQIREFAYDANNSGYDPTPTTVRLTPPPDLEVEAVAVSAEGVASHAFNINYRVRNAGATATPNYAWTDSFYLSIDDQFDAETDLFFGKTTHLGALDAGAFYDATATLTLPNGLNGSYHVFVATDSGNSVFELDKVNNVSINSAQTTIVSKPADLVIAPVNLPANLEAGKATRLNWTVTNQGTGDTAVSNWTDKIFISTDSIFDSGDILLGSFDHVGLLNAGESYVRSELVAVPFTLEGPYHLFFTTDQENKVYEADRENNNASTVLTTVSRQTPDLQITQATSSLFNRSLTVDWTVQNLGVGRTNANFWYDGIYLSRDEVLDDSDILLGQVFHSGALDLEGQYSASKAFDLPVDLEGAYKVIVHTDDKDRDQYRDAVVEGALENNNDRVVTAPMLITPGAVPNLAVAAVDVPSDGISGQGVEVTWTVRNDGANTSGQAWYDAIYLSRDQSFDRSTDIYLGSRFHEGGLASGQSYTTTQSFKVPQGLSGPFYAFAIADSGNAVYERSLETDNVGYDAYSIQLGLPQPADLVVGNITVPANAMPGQSATISYTVMNQGPNAARGSWADSIYLSADDTWDINDVLFGAVQHLGDVANGGSYTETLTAELPGVVPGDYKVIIRSDIRNAIVEGNETNNIGGSLDQVAIDVQALQLGSVASGSLSQGQSAYYRIDVPEGETVQITFDASNDNAFNELYVRYGQVPSQAAFDVGFDSIAADQKIVVPLTQAGTYYILARGQNVPTNQESYTIEAKTVDFGITSIGQHVGDRGGKITVEIDGARFGPGVQAILEDGAGHSITASKLWYEDSTKVFATFDLTTATVGTYDLKLMQSLYTIDFGESEDEYPDPTVTTEVVSAALKNTFTVVEARPDDLLVSVDSPTAIRKGNNFDVLVSYTNRGSHDIAAPVIVLSTSPDVLLQNVQDADGFKQYGSMALLGISNEGPASILRPGETGLIRLRATPPGNGFEGAINVTARPMIDDGSTIDYGDFIKYLGGDLLDPAWIAAATALQNRFGSSWTSFASGLAAEVDKEPSSNSYTHSVTKLWTEIARDAWVRSVLDDPQEALSNTLSGVSSVASTMFASNRSSLYTSEIAENSFAANEVTEPEFAAGTMATVFDDIDTRLRAKESILERAAGDMAALGADNAAFALIQFIGVPGPEAPPFLVGYGPEAIPLTDAEKELQANAYSRHIFEDVVHDSLIASLVVTTSKNKVRELGPKNSENFDSPPSYPYGSLYNVNFFDSGSPLSKEVFDSREYQEKIHLDDRINGFFKNYVDERFTSTELQLGLNSLQDYIDVSDPHQGGFDGFRFFELTNLLNYPRYFENEGAKDLALMLGRTGKADQRIKINSIKLDEPKGTNGTILNYDIDFDFYFWDSTTFEAEDAKKNLVFDALNFPFSPYIADNTFIVQVLKALGYARPIQQAGYGQPSMHVIQVHDVIKGTIYNRDPHPERDDFPSPPDFPVPSTPPQDLYTPGGAPGLSSLPSFATPDFPFDTTVVLGSADPNDIIGPQGFGTEHWITASDSLNYTIRFENDPNLATAPAQVVRITQKLDSDLDFRTFRLGDFGFGDTFIDVPDNRAFYQTRLDLMDTKGIVVDVIAGVDVATGEVFWEFTSIEPATGLAPTNPLLGFLPPDLTSPEGEGFVSYSVRPKANIADGSVIDAQARIVFDINEPIETPAILNTIDTSKPTSTVKTLPLTSADSNFLVSWSGSDNANGSALAAFTIYVSDNGGAFVPWLEKTTLTEANFVGEAGHTYAFYSQAQDNAGNLEVVSTSAQASTTINGVGELAFSTTEFSVNENGTTIAAVTVTRINGNRGTVGATISLSDDTALSLLDYDNTPIVVNFADGETTKTILIPVIDDALVEAPEKLQLALSNPTGGATLGTQKTATLTIVDDDVELSFSDLQYSTLEDGTPIAAIIVNRTGRSTGVVSATVSLSNGTANAASDYDSLPLVVSFADGEMSKTVTVPIVNDTLIEANETVNLTLSNPTGGATIGAKNSATLVIVDDDVALAFSNAQYSINEDGSAGAVITVTRMGRSTGAVGATLVLSNGTAHTPDDYSATPILVSFADGETTKTVNLPVVDDALVETNETINLTLENATGGATIGAMSHATLTVVDNDVALAFSDTQYSFKEDETASATVTIVRVGRSTGAVSAAITLTNGTAVAPEDYNSAAILVSFAEGEMSKTVTLPIISDTRFESDETLSLTLSNPTGGATIGAKNSAIVTILNDDVPPVTRTGTTRDDTLTGGAGDDTLYGLVGNDTLYGLAGDDVLDGGDGNDVLDGGTGNDVLRGGLGNDTYIVDRSGDSILEGVNAGTDIVKASVSWTLGDNLENLLLTGNDAIDGTGNALNNVLTGNTAGNRLFGLGGNDTLTGGDGNDLLDGGSGNDMLQGGLGDDIYVVNSTGDRITEASNAGNDTVQASASWTLGSNLENLLLIGTDAINGTGNSLDNILVGNGANNNLVGGSGNDTLIGGAGDDTLDGGTGEDSLSGGIGDDLYNVDSLGDRITEALNAGTDSVKASVDWTLGANLENLTLTGTRAINGTGNALANVISGNSAGNTLFGLGGNDTLIGGNGNDVLDGGEGNDALTGGAGNDTYILDSEGDRITEELNAGTDTVQASVSWVLGDNLENLVLTGNEPISGTGNALNNVMTGNAVRSSLFGMGGNDTLTGGDGDDLLDGGDGNDTLTGGAGNDIITGGFGNDVLTGNAGADRFVLNQPGQGVDKIADFVATEDKLLVSASVFGGGLVAGAGLTTDQLRIGAGAVAATSANQRFIYNTSTGALYFDADGNLGGSASIQVSTLTTKPLIGSGSFAITL